MAKKKETVEKQKTVKPIGPYDIIQMMFTNNDGFNKLTDIILDKNFFIINRAFAIKYPLQAALFNKLQINTAAVIKSWKNFMNSKEGYGRVPYFIYTKGAKKTTEVKVKTSDNIDKETKKEYCKRYHISLKDYENLKLFFYDELIADVKRYSKLISLKEQEKKIS